MKIRELLTELKLDVPDQMVSVQVPLSTVMQPDSSSEDSDLTVINPGKRVDSDGQYKWSPPLQQQLDVSKDAVGISNDETDQQSANVEAAKELVGDQDMDDLRSKLAQILSQKN
jgi:hypothetical protein